MDYHHGFRTKVCPVKRSNHFLIRVSRSGPVLLWSSYLGGSQSEGRSELAHEPSGNQILTGPTRSLDFPTTFGAYDRFPDGENDVFLVRFNVNSLGGVYNAVHVLPQPCDEPNPFSGAMQARFDLSQSAEVDLRALDASGRQVALLRQGFLPAGGHWIWWDGRDARGRPLPSGIYWLRAGPNGAVR